MPLPWRSRSPDAAPADVRRDLDTAFSSGDTKRFISLCEQHQETIATEFPAWWADHPSPVDSAGLERHVQMLGNVAMLFDQRLGRPELLALAMGAPEENLVARWHTLLDEGESSLAAGDEDRAIEIGRDVLAREGEQLGGNLAEERARAMFLIGSGLFRSGDVSGAREPLEHAIASYRSTDDLPPLPIVLELFDVDRYLGAAGSAAALADLLANNLEGDGGRFYHQQAAILRAGEPLLRVIAHVGGMRYEIDDAPGAVRAGDGAVSVAIEFRRNRPSIARSARATERGMALAASGDHVSALAAFDQAADIDPYDPQPAYQVGILMLEQGRWDEARAAFGIADGLAPGWFFARRYAWLAEQVAVGDVQPATAQVAIRADESGDPVGRIGLLDRAIALDSDLGLLHLYAGQAEAEMGRLTDAAARYRRGLEGRLEEDVRAALEYGLGLALRETGDGRSYLGRAAAAADSPYTAGLARLTLALGT